MTENFKEMKEEDKKDTSKNAVKNFNKDLAQARKNASRGEIRKSISMGGGYKDESSDEKNVRLYKILIILFLVGIVGFWVIGVVRRVGGDMKREGVERREIFEEKVGEEKIIEEKPIIEEKTPIMEEEKSVIEEEIKLGDEI